MAEFAQEQGAGLRDRLRRGVAWNALASVAGQGSAFVASLIVANMLGRDAFGQFSIILSSVLTLAGIAQAASGVTATRYVAEYRQVDPSRAGRVLRLCSVFTWITGSSIALGLVLVAPWLAEDVLKATELRMGFVIGSLSVLFSAVNGFQIGALAGLERYRSLARASIAQGLLHLILCGAGTWLGGLEGAVAAVAVSSFVRWVVFARVLRREAVRCGIPSEASKFGEERAILWRFALPAATGGLIALPALWIGQALLARQTNGYAELGLYTAATNLRLLVMFAPLMLNTVGMSILNNQVGANDSRRYQRVFWLVLGVTALTASVGTIAVGLLGPWLLSLFGPGFAEGRTVLQVLLLSTIVESLAVAAYQVMQSHEKMWMSLLCIGIPRDGLMIVLAWALVPLWGARGLAAAYLLAWSVCLAMIVLIVVRLGLDIPKSAARRAIHLAS